MKYYLPPALIWPCLFGTVLCFQPALADGSAGKKSPHYELNATSDTFQLGTEESVLAWESWHHRVSKLLAKRINHTIGKMMGKAVLRMKIDREQNVAIEILPASENHEFALKCLEGAQSLNKDEALKFPEGSKRSFVAFDLTFKRSWLTIPGLKFARDDYERLSP